MRILFIGCVESSYCLLNGLIQDGNDVVGVITKSQSDFNADFCDITSLCRNYNIPFCYVTNINDSDSIEFITSCKPDIGFCFGWSQLVRGDVIDLFPQGMVGFHPAELPYNRGRHPIIWALALGLKETASSFFMLTEGADEGDIVSQRKIPIQYDDDARSLYDKILSVAVEQERELVQDFENNNVKRIKQEVGSGNAWRKRGRNDGLIDWRMSSRAIYNLVRSLTKPYIGAHLDYNGTEYKVWKVEELNVSGKDNMEPGKVLAVNNDGTVDVKVYGGAIRLLEFDTVELKQGEYIL